MPPLALTDATHVCAACFNPMIAEPRIPLNVPIWPSTIGAPVDCPTAPVLVEPADAPVSVAPAGAPVPDAPPATAAIVVAVALLDPPLAAPSPLRSPVASAEPSRLGP